MPLRGHERDVDLSDCKADPIKKHELPRYLVCLTYHLPQPHLIVGSLRRSLRRTSLCKQPVSVHKKLAKFSKMARKSTNLSTEHHSRETNGREPISS